MDTCHSSLEVCRDGETKGTRSPVYIELCNYESWYDTLLVTDLRGFFEDARGNLCDLPETDVYKLEKRDPIDRRLVVHRNIFM